MIKSQPAQRWRSRREDIDAIRVTTAGTSYQFMEE